MHRYLAFAWNAEDAQQADTARQLVHRAETNSQSLRRVFCCPGLAVFWADDFHGVLSPHLLDGKSGVVLGRLFHREIDAQGSVRSVVFGEAETKLLMRERGKALMDRYWGRYIAFILDEVGRTVCVIPEPTGSIPCNFMRYRGICVLFSSAEDCVTLGLEFSINWRYVAASLVQPFLQVRETGLNEVLQIRAGETLEIAAGIPKAPALSWDLPSMAHSQGIEDMDAAVAAARETLRGCVSAWASCYPRIVHLLSGGIDSSVVLACLAQAPSQPAVTCLNMFDESVGGDERRFARIAAQGIRSPSGSSHELLEYQRDTSHVRLEMLHRLRRSARPSTYLSLCCYRDYQSQIARARQSVIFDGHGGDYIFYKSSKAKPAVDYVYRHGLGKDLLRIALESARSDSTFLSVLWTAIAARWQRRQPGYSSILDKRAFAPPALLESFKGELDTYLSPVWLQSVPILDNLRIPPSKQEHVDMMYVPAPDFDPFLQATNLEWISPIVSQPIMELFARIPAYLLKAGGRDRVVARRAFGSDLPQQLLSRRSKGVTNTFILSVFRMHEKFFKEMILDGVLVKEGLLDRRKVEAFFADARDGYTAGITSLLGSHMDTEVWLQSWQSTKTAGTRVTA